VLLYSKCTDVLFNCNVCSLYKLFKSESYPAIFKNNNVCKERIAYQAHNILAVCHKRERLIMYHSVVVEMQYGKYTLRI